MANDPAETRKRILLLSVILGMMAGVTVYLAFKAVTSGNLVLLVVVLPLAIMSVPMVRGLIELRRSAAAGSGPAKTP